MRILKSSAILGFICFSINLWAAVPGDGYKVHILSDDFEDPNWVFYYNSTKTDGLSSNGLWRGSFRGVPEILERISPPTGGPTSSAGALRIRSYDNGDDAYRTQEDLVSAFYNARFGRNLTRTDQPNLSVHLYIPAYASMQTEWATIGFRMEAWTATSYYYPSIWAYLAYDRLYFVARLGDGYAADVALPNPQFFNWQGGWVTLGIAFDDMGVGHYYIKAGVLPFSSSDKVYDTSQFPGGSDPRLNYLYYHFFSLGYPQGPQLSPDFVIDNVAVYSQYPSDCQQVIQAGFGLKSDLDGNCRVDLNDLALFMAEWLDCIVPGDSRCRQPWL